MTRTTFISNRLTKLVLVGCAVGIFMLATGCSNEVPPGVAYRDGLLITGSLSQVEPPRTPKTTVIVQPGDTLESIARENRISVYGLTQVNELDNSHIRPGQLLHLPTH